MADMRIEIRTNPTVSVMRVMMVPHLIQVAVIGVGIASDSAATQWAGFVFLCLLLVVSVILHNQKNTGLTISQARARIDEIEERETP